MSFLTCYRQYNWNSIQSDIYQKTPADVERVLSKRGSRTLEDFKILVSPAADCYLKEMAAISRLLTRQRFGNIVQMYIPLYLSNECTNSCKYCGFSKKNEIPRITLSIDQVLSEANVIKNMGFEHVLLVSGESKTVDVDYLKTCINILQPHFANISIEVPPLEQVHYESLIEAGLHAVYIYQETYGPEYSIFHPKGKKSDFNYRLLTPDRLGAAGVYKMGLGFLIGLDDWRTDAWFMAAHLDYLVKTHWRSKYCISFPRLRAAAGNFRPPIEISDRQLVQLICAYRIFDENVELSLSTRETELFRDHVFQLGITAMSAGSKTSPGGYSLFNDILDQFQVEDLRTPEQVTAMISAKGYKPVWKDWFRM
ncbi:2-iminoacetate synthase ThiH [bacterium]|nr:2-iminoacetate synthase ThiH [bacterium]